MGAKAKTILARRQTFFLTGPIKALRGRLFVVWLHGVFEGDKVVPVKNPIVAGTADKSLIQIERQQTIVAKRCLP